MLSARLPTLPGLGGLEGLDGRCRGRTQMRLISLEMTPVTFRTMDEALLELLSKLLRDGQRASPRGFGTTELLGYGFRLSNPRARRIGLPGREWKESLAVGEFCWHLSQSDSLAFIAYYTPTWEQFSEDGERIVSSCYGKRIFGGGHRSQWQRVRGALAGDLATRRAVLTLVDTEGDLTSAKDVSCVTSMQFLARGGQLNCITTMRSCDVIWGLSYDVYFCTMLQELMAVQLGIELGWYQHSCGSLHLYDQFKPMATQIVSEGLVSEADPMASLDTPEALPGFLGVEEALRDNHANAAALVAALPEYWRALASPLRRLHNRRWGALGRNGAGSVLDSV